MNIEKRPNSPTWVRRLNKWVDGTDNLEYQIVLFLKKKTINVSIWSYITRLKLPEVLDPTVQPTSIWELTSNLSHNRAETELSEAIDRLVHTGSTIPGYVDHVWKRWRPERKAHFARWVCATATEELLDYAREEKDRRLYESTVLIARRTILQGANATQEFEGKLINREWLEALLSNVLQANPKPEIKLLLKEFVDNPPEINSTSQASQN